MPFVPSPVRRAVDAFISFYWRSGIADDVPALTYYMVVSLVPFALGMAALGALIFGDYVSPMQITDGVARLLPAAVRDDVNELVLRTQSESRRLLLVALLAMMWTSSGAIGVIERVLARILDLPRYPMVLGKIRNLMLGGALGASVVAAAAAGVFTSGASDRLGVTVDLPALTTTVVHYAGTVLLCAVVYRFCTRGGVRWRAAFTGAVPAAAVMNASPMLVGLYFSRAGGLSTGRVFVGVAVVMIACHIFAQGLLIGAGLVARAQKRASR